jgi:cyclohexanone monooxygenase
MPKSPARFDAVIIGAGFAGMYMLYRLREMGLSVRVFEAGADVGGTWYWNRYPGARCDVESMEYSYQFSDDLQQEWNWTERYATQSEILAYANHVADRFELRPDIRFNCRVASAVFDETAGRWDLVTEAGDALNAQFCIFATGCLSVPLKPHFEGLESFRGDVYYTGEWPHEPVDFSGKRVAVIGTGSSGIQSIPIIAAQARQLTVFQRSATYSVPAHNAPLDPRVRDRIKANYADFRARNKAMGGGFAARHMRSDGNAMEASPQERQRQLEMSWQAGGLVFLSAFQDLMRDQEANEVAREFVRNKIREQVDDPQVAELLCPDTTIGCKRLCVDTDYYRTYNRDNVALVDIRRHPIRAITETGILCEDSEREFDAIVFATGFDAMTGALNRVDIQGRGGLVLRDKWREGPRTYLGLQTAGFPNLFMITAPGSPSVLSNMLQSIEQHVEWVADFIAWLEQQGLKLAEPAPLAEEEWMEIVAAQAAPTVFNSCNSWYVGANVEGKPRVFMPFIDVPTYVACCEEIVARGYPGFVFS